MIPEQSKYATIAKNTKSKTKLCYNIYGDETVLNCRFKKAWNLKPRQTKHKIQYKHQNKKKNW